MSHLLNELEGKLRVWATVGGALLEIRDKELYREGGYETFEEYCWNRWDIAPADLAEYMSMAELWKV
jgi:hypothetical protein